MTVQSTPEQDWHVPSVRLLVTGPLLVALVALVAVLIDGGQFRPFLFGIGVASTPLAVLAIRRLARSDPGDGKDWLATRRGKISFVLAYLGGIAILEFVLEPLMPVWLVGAGMWWLLGLVTTGAGYLFVGALVTLVPS